MNHELKQAFDDAMAKAAAALRAGQLDEAFAYLEVAHILGQRYVVPHVQTHWHMLRIGWRRASPAQVSGQLIRILIGAIGSTVGIVPIGNTGGTNINMFRRLPIPPALATIPGMQ